MQIYQNISFFLIIQKIKTQFSINDFLGIKTFLFLD